MGILMMPVLPKKATMKFVLVLSALVAAVFADSGTVYEASYYPSEPAPINTDPSLKIVNGQNAFRDQVPYQISLQRRLLVSFSHICGGSIIAPSWILTAAHCVHNGNPANFRIVAGILLLNDQAIPGQQAIGVSQIISHPGYPGGSQVAPDDIALLHLSQSLAYTANNVRPITVPVQNSVWNGDALLSGWGLTSTGGSSPNNLQVADLPIVPALECNQIMNSFLGANRNPFDVNLNVCSGIRFGGESACNGDSGGPLVVSGRVIGVVSWGLTPCGQANAPSVYARTSAYANWIVQQTHGAVIPQ